MKWVWCLLGAMLLTVLQDAQAARRLGGGRSIGQQSQNVAPRQAQPAQNATNSVAPNQNAAGTAPATRPGNATPAPTTPAPAPTRPWGSMLGGLAAGMGLAWLAHSLGLGGALAGLLPLALLLLALGLLVAVVRRRAAQSGRRGSAPLAFEGAGGASVPLPGGGYKPEHVGNDASARPWERTSMLLDVDAAGQATSSGSRIGAALRQGAATTWTIPEGFDVAGFVANAKQHFVTLQAAWDRADLNTLRGMMTDTMLREVQAQLAEREPFAHGQAPMTRVDMLDARLLGVEDQGDQWLASVEFSGLICEDGSAGPAPFCEVWNLARTKSGSDGWLVAGVQALQ